MKKINKMFTKEMREVASDTWPGTGNKRKQLFFASDVIDCVDYIEYMAEKFEEPHLFKRAVVNKIAATYVEGAQ